MQITEFFIPGKYENPLTANGRARTIAAFHLAQGNDEVLTTDAEMRRDILNNLMSSRAVGYWLNDMGWLEKSRKVGTVQFLRLTSSGLITCTNAIRGGSNVPTTPELVRVWRRQFLEGAPGFERKSFKSLPSADA